MIAEKRRNYRRLINPELVAVPARTPEYYAIYRKLRKERRLISQGVKPTGPAATLEYIKERCRRPSINRYEYYGGRGIRNYLSLDDLIFLWNRDGADKLRRPSLDRIDTGGHYTLTNCRYIELSENVRRRWIRVCSECGQESSKMKSGKCGKCSSSEIRSTFFP